MTSFIKHKRVEFTELFYDLVFVYAISKTTGLIHPIGHEFVNPIIFFTFFTCLVVLINTWMIQTIFTNRYGKNSLFNMTTMFLNMGILMFLSNMFTLKWKENFHIFSWTLGLLSLILLLQYWIQYQQLKKQKNDRDLIKAFFFILGIRTISSLISALLPYKFGIVVLFLGIFSSFLMPILFNKKMTTVPINFPHLVERISLLVIIIFGEMIMNVASFFTLDNIRIHSIIYLLIIIFMFLLYFGEFDHALNLNVNSLGLRLIYSHYLIITGMIITTVSMNLLIETTTHYLFETMFLYSGLFLFLFALLLNGTYNKPAYKWTRNYLSKVITIFILAFILSIFLSYSNNLVLYLTTIMLLLIEIVFIRFYIKQHRISQDSHEFYLI